jgi:hypothetical protein
VVYMCMLKECVTSGASDVVHGAKQMSVRAVDSSLNCGLTILKLIKAHVLSAKSAEWTNGFLP